MALQKTELSLNLGNGIDQKSDNKIGPDNAFAEMKDWIYQKIGKLYKRFGTNKLSSTVVTTFPNPLTIGASDIPSSTFTYKDQILLQNKGALYSFYENQNSWYFKGHHYPVEVDTKTSISSELNYDSSSSYYVNGLRVLVYTAIEPLAISTQILKYTVIEHSTGNVLVDDVTIDTQAIGTGKLSDARVMVFSSTAFLIWQNVNDIKIAQISTTSGQIGTINILKSDAAQNGFTDSSDVTPYNFVITNKAGVGERAIVVYKATGNLFKVFAVLSNGNIDGSISEYSSADSATRGFGITYNTTLDRIFIAYQLSTFAIQIKVLTFTSSSITQNTDYLAKAGTKYVMSFDLITNPVNTSQVIFLYDEFDTDTYYVNSTLTTTYNQPILNKNILNATATVSNVVLGIGYKIIGSAVSDSNRNTVYSFIVNTVGNQVTYFMVDLLKGKTEDALYVQAKWDYSVAAPTGAVTTIPQTSFIGSKIYLARTKLVDLIGNPFGSVPLSPVLSAKLGISETFLELEPNQSGSYVFLGNAIHSSGGYLGYYDSSEFYESSFFINPECFKVTLSGTGTDFPASGAYQYCAVWTYFDVNGQQIRSAASLPITVSLNGSQRSELEIYTPNLTNRNVSSIRVEWYRTKVNGTVFYKISTTAEDKAWTIGSATVTFIDNKNDVAINNSPELLYTTGGVLNNYQISATKSISNFKNRIVAVDANDPTGFYYSKTAINGAPIEFAEENFVQVDVDSDPIVGHTQLDDKLIVFKKKKIYYLAGDGVNDLGTGSSFSPPTLVASDVGCVDKNSIVQMPNGIMFKSEKGIYLLDRGLSVSYIGKEVEDYNSITIMGAALLKEVNQVRFILKTGDSLVYDYLFNRWTPFSSYSGDGCCIWRGDFSRIDSSGRIYVEDNTIWTDAGSAVTSYSPTLTTKWLQVKNVQDYSRIYKLAILGDLKSAHTLNYKIYYDYDDTNFDEYNFNSSNITGSQYDDSVYQPIIHLKRQKCDAIKIKMTVIPSGGTEESLELVDMSFTVGLKKGLQKVKAAKKL